MAKIKYKLKPEKLPNIKAKVESKFTGSSVLTFGKYKGRLLRDIINIDPSYLLWASSNIKWFKLPDNLLAKITAGVSAPKNKNYSYGDDEDSGFAEDSNDRDNFGEGFDVPF